MQRLVPVRAQIPICYTLDVTRGIDLLVPVRAQIPICYTRNPVTNAIV